MSDCPNPEKDRYWSERAARAAVRSIKRHKRDGPGFLRPYRCGNHWHVGHGHKNTHTIPGRRFR